MQLTILFVVLVFVIVKICAMYYDNTIFNKVSFWQNMAFLLLIISNIVVVSSQFFITPSDAYHKYLEPLASKNEEER